MSDWKSKLNSLGNNTASGLGFKSSNTWNSPKKWDYGKTSGIGYKPIGSLGFGQGQVQVGVSWWVIMLVVLVILCLLSSATGLLWWFKSDICDAVEAFDGQTQINDDKQRNN